MKRSEVDREMKARYRNWRTISRSVTLDRTDLIDIGRKSDSSLGLAVLATGQIEARFYWDGTTDADNDRLRKGERIRTFMIHSAVFTRATLC